MDEPGRGRLRSKPLRREKGTKEEGEKKGCRIIENEEGA